MLIHFPKREDPDCKVLSIGEDDDLLESRRMLLEGSGYGVVSLRAKDLIDQTTLPAADLAVLCHSVRDEEWDQLLRRIESQFPKSRILLLDGPSIRGRSRETQVMWVVPTQPEFLLPLLKRIVHHG